MKKQSTHFSRRHFLKTSAAFGAITVLPAHIALGKKANGDTLPPSARINLAAIGIGHQGGRDLERLYKSGHCNVVALCDVDLQGKHTQKSQADHPDAATFTDFRKMFDKMADKIDAVLVATPDHSHFSAAMLAMSLGKHVYVEKPLAHTFGQTARLIDLAERSGVVTQMGNQGHSGANYFQFKEWAAAGVITGVERITAYMNRSRRWHPWGNIQGYPKDELPPGLDWDQWHDSVATERPFSSKLHPGNWRGWHEFGCGAFGDWGPHILDTAHRFLKLGLPTKVSALHLMNQNDFIYPTASTIKFDFAERGPGLPACSVTWYDGQENVPELESEYSEPVVDKETGKTTRQPTKPEQPGKIIYGKDLVFQGGHHADVLRVVPKEKFMDIRTSLPRFSQKNSGHWENFLLACKGEEEARSPFHVSGPLTQVFNIGLLAQRFGGEIDFDPETSQVTNNKAANALLDPAPRQGWEEFYKL